MMRIPLTHRGFAAVAAIFLVLVLASLGAFMVTLSNTQQLTSAQDVQGTRAYWAARAGLEWGIGTVAASTGAPPACPTLPPPTTGSSAPVSSNTTLPTAFDGGFSVSVKCARNDYVEGAVTPSTLNVFIYQFTSEASTTGASPGSVGYIQRSVSASMQCVRNEAVPPATLPTYSCG